MSVMFAFLLNAPPHVGPEASRHLGQKRELAEHHVDAAARPVTDETKLVSLLEPASDLFNGSEREIGRQSGLPGGRHCARHDIATCVSDTRNARPRAEWKGQGNHAAATN